MTRKAGDNNFANYVGWQAFSSDEPKIVNRYSNALPFPVIPTLVKVDAGNNPLRISNALALVEPL